MSISYSLYIFAICCAFLLGYYYRKWEEEARALREQREYAERAAHFYHAPNDDELANVVTIDAKAIIPLHSQGIAK